MVSNPITEYHSTTKRGLRWTDDRGRVHFVKYNTLEFIVIHWWGDPATNPKFDAIVHGLAVSYKVSANYVSENSRLAQIAEPNILTWHAMSANSKSCAIENNPRCSAGDVLMCAKTIAHIWQFAGRKIPLKKHKDVVATACPGPVWSWWVNSGELYKVAEQLYKGKEIDMVTAAQVWDEVLDNGTGGKLPARRFITAIDAYTRDQPSRVWDSLIENKWGSKHGARHILASVDKNTHDALISDAEITAKLDVVLEQLQVVLEQIEKLKGVDPEALNRKITEATAKNTRNIAMALTNETKQDEGKDNDK